MRCLVVAALVAAVACKGDAPASSSKPAPGPGDSRQADAAEVAADDQSRFDQERQPEFIIGALGLRPGMTVADVGAGTGLLTVHVARAVFPGGHVVATDIDSAVLDYLHARMEAAGFDSVVETRVVEASAPGLEAGRYDLILLAQVDHYFDDRVAWLTKAAPALKPDGRLAISNRMQHRAAAMAAAAAVGFTLVKEVNDLPGQFVAVFAKAPKPSPPAKASP
ncbi:MAG: class I SAM-dependent methyltransferase [Kofleriaceae bacterium]